MMQQPLLISSLLRHAERHHADARIVSKRVEGDLHRMTYGDAWSRRIASYSDGTMLRKCSANSTTNAGGRGRSNLTVKPTVGSRGSASLVGRI
jgi:hypothetical protein